MFVCCKSQNITNRLLSFALLFSSGSLNVKRIYFHQPLSSRKDRIEQQEREERRVAFRHFGTACHNVFYYFYSRNKSDYEKWEITEQAAFRCDGFCFLFKDRCAAIKSICSLSPACILALALFLSMIFQKDFNESILVVVIV